MQFVTKEQIDQFYYNLKDKDVVGLNEILSVFEEVFDYPVHTKMLSEDNKSKMTKSIFMNPEILKSLREAAEDTELIDNEEEIMRIVREVQNDSK